MIELGNIKIDANSIERQLRNDLQDDWFPDSIRFKDYFSANRISNTVKRMFEDNHGKYVPNLRVVDNVPKPDFTIRVALETDIIDRAIYQGVSSFLCNWFDPLIPWFVFSHRKNPGKPNPRYMFRRGIPAWIDFLGAVRAAVRPGMFLVSTDLTNYFDNIRTEELHNEMLGLIPRIEATAAEKNVVRTYVDFLFECLKSWSYNTNRGLPQNRDASSFLANVYMRRVDLRMADAGYTYFRYMDDIKIVCSSELEARQALFDLIVELRQLGLAVNSKKTEIVDVVDEAVLSNCIEEPTPEIRYLQSLWDTRKTSQIKQSFEPLRQLAITCLRQEKLSSREFRFAINRLVLLAGCPEIAAPDRYFDEVTDLMIDAIAKQPSPTDKYVSYLERVPLSPEHLGQLVAFVSSPDQNMYEWQAYRLWLLFGAIEFDNDALKASARTHLDRRDCPSRSGATLYLGAFGTDEDRERIAEKFSELTTFLGQRSALIALQELPFRPNVEDHVADNVRTELIGIYRHARNNNIGYFSEPEPISITRIVDGERDYA